MTVLYIALYAFAAFCFAIAALSVTGSFPRRVDVIAAGLLAWVLVPLIHTAHR